MEKKLIFEINKINNLMGTNIFISETTLASPISPWDELLEGLMKNADQLSKLEEVIKEYRKNTNGLTKTDVNRLCKRLEKEGILTAEESLAFRKALTGDTDLFNMLKNSDDFAESLKSLKGKSKTKVEVDKLKGLPDILKKINLTDVEKQKIIGNAANDAMRNTQTGLYKLYKHIDDVFLLWYEAVENLGKNFMVKNTEEFFLMAEKKVQEYLQRQVDLGFLSKEEAQAAYDAISEELRCCSEMAKKIEGIESQRVVGETAKTTEIPKIKEAGTPQDLNFKIPYNDNVVWKQEPTTYKTPPNPNNYRDLPTVPNDGVPMQAEVQFSDTSLKPKKIKNLPPLIQRLHNFWINSIEPWWTYFLTTWRVNMRARFKADFKIMQEQFLAKADRAFQDYKLGDAGSAGTKFANYRKLMYEFLEYPSRAKMKIPNSAKNVYKQLWDDFVSYGEKMYAGNPEQLRDFRNFCAYRDWETDRKSTRLNSSH